MQMPYIEYDYDYFGFSEYRPGAYTNEPYYDDMYRSYDGEYNYYDYPNASGPGGSGGGTVGVTSSSLAAGASPNASLSGGQRSARAPASGPTGSPGVMVRYSIRILHT